MENKSNYEKTVEILKNNINRILNEKDQSMAWLSRKIAEVLRVSVADLFIKNDG